MGSSKVLCFFFIFIAGASSSFAEMSTQLGVGYGKQFRGNTDLAQYEIFWRQPLPYETTLGDNWNISTGIEFGAALLRESGSNNDGTGRFSIMPQVILSPHDMVNFIVGVGAGFMEGETDFTDQNLGGAFLINSKVGVQVIFGEHWGLEYTFYHQSNAGIYDHNSGLNMNLLAFVYNF
jgi:hypothetical protein